jgi:DNA-directed RNA polymerase sigma subunit (sigma70/sigma32)
VKFGAMTQWEIARELGISQTRVQQLERSALRKLSKLPEAKFMLQLVRFVPAKKGTRGTA